MNDTAGILQSTVVQHTIPCPRNQSHTLSVLYVNQSSRISQINCELRESGPTQLSGGLKVKSLNITNGEAGGHR